MFHLIVGVVAALVAALVCVVPVPTIASPCPVCPPPSGLCLEAACSGVTCVEVPRPAGAWCASGVGVCNAAGDCVAPGGSCVLAQSQWQARCRQHEDCDDGNPCTYDECSATWCVYQPETDGTACGVSWACDRGACCAP